MRAQAHINTLLVMRQLVPLAAVDVLFFNAVNPAKSSSFLIIAGCILLLITLYVVNRAVAKLGAFFFSYSKQTQRRLAMCMTTLLGFLLLMQSIGQLDVRDVLAAVALIAAFFIYVSYIARENMIKSI